jgi:hypothetical protein
MQNLEFGILVTHSTFQIPNSQFRGRRTIVSISFSRAAAGLPVRPVCTGDIWMMVLRGDTSQ